MSFSVRAGAVSLLGAAACLPVRGAPASARQFAGTLAARVAVTGRSTYTGELQLAPLSDDSIAGSMRLTRPLAVDIKLGGRMRRDSITLAGTYNGANGCSGEFTATLPSLSNGTSSGPFELSDKCVGKLAGIMTVSR